MQYRHNSNLERQAAIIIFHDLNFERVDFKTFLIGQVASGIFSVLTLAYLWPLFFNFISAFHLRSIKNIVFRF